ncbi:MAG: sigma-70 family RNA polymerase sigma factor [Bacteroidota bacterium]
MSQLDLNQRLRSGDPELLRGLYTSVLPSVKSWIQSNSGNTEDALDIFQDSIEALIRKAVASGIGHDSNIEALLIQICKNKWIDKIRKKKTEDKVRSENPLRYEDDYSSEEHLIAIEEEELRQRSLQASFSRLSSTCQQLLEMVMTGQDVKSIVKKLGMSSPNTMYRRKHACMESWRTYLNDVRIGS